MARLRCPQCATVNDFAAGAAHVCAGCGYGSPARTAAGAPSGTAYAGSGGPAYATGTGYSGSGAPAYATGTGYPGSGGHAYAAGATPTQGAYAAAPVYPDAGYAPSYVVPTEPNPRAVTGMVLGIVALVMMVFTGLVAIPILGVMMVVVMLGLPIAGLVVSISGMRAANDPTVSGRGMAVAGVVMNAIALAWWAVVALFLLIIMAMFASFASF